ncbi:MAG: polyprenol monophosphomannose synthase [Bdellovibrio sp.]
MKTLVIVPTYNERENIPKLLQQILQLNPEVHILVVDDNSPDATAQVVQELQKNDPRIHLLLRQQKQGLGKAYLAGFRWGLENSFETLVEMDADFSHRPEDLVKILQALHTSDFVIGSRYVPGGATLHWGWIRKLISRGGGIYSRLILGYPIRDWTGGFNAWRSPVLKALNLDGIQSNGYSFQIELKYKASRLGFKGQEVPIIFEDRRVGQSKMSLGIVLEAFYKVWLLR